MKFVDQLGLIFIIIAIMLMFMLVLSAPPAHGEVQIDELTAFLAEDATDSNEYLPWYTCGHFCRDLARNASLHNISLGSAMLGNHPVFRGDNHAMNYIDINGSRYLINSQTDQVYLMNTTHFRYLRFYSNGIYIPSHHSQNLAHHLDLGASVWVPECN